jgi:hypothetical protein
MKKIILLIYVTSISLFSFGQNNKFGISLTASIPSQDPERIYDQPSIWDAENFNIERKSYSVGILANYNFNDTTTFRLRFGITKHDIRVFQDSYDYSFHFFDSIFDQQTNIHIAPGVIWNIKIKKMLFYLGCEIPFNLLGNYISTNNHTSNDSITENTMYITHNTTNRPKGYSLGMGAIFGLSYYPIKHFSLDLEFSPSILYSVYSGKYSNEYTQTFPSNVTSTTLIEYKNRGYFCEQRLLIRLTYWF